MRHLVQASRPMKKKKKWVHDSSWEGLGLFFHCLSHCFVICMCICLETFEVYKWHTITMTTFKFSQNSVYAAPPSNCMSQYTIIITLQYMIWYTWHAIVVQFFKCLTQSNIIHTFSMFPPPCMTFTRSISLTLWRQIFCPLIGPKIRYHGWIWRWNGLSTPTPKYYAHVTLIMRQSHDNLRTQIYWICPWPPPMTNQPNDDHLQLWAISKVNYQKLFACYHDYSKVYGSICCHHLVCYTSVSHL